MRPSSAKAKGRRLQQDICRAILSTFPQLDVADVTSRSMGAPGEDVLLSPLARELFPFDVEARNREGLNIWASLAQAEERGGRPLVVFKRNHSETYAALPFADLLELLLLVDL